MKNFLFCEPLAELDPELGELIDYEAERQTRKLIMVPSESIAPMAVHEAVASVFSHIYAEGYPDERTRKMTEAEILDYETELGHYRRYSDRRYYKGVEYADVLEALARRRTAEVFANGHPADKIYVNVQALSGAPANTAVQYALLDPGDTMMSMSLYVGGHLTHGSKVAYSGKTYNVVPYGVDARSELIDYDAVRQLAIEHRPKLIIAGYTSYPRAVDWRAFRAIADEVGAYLMADIAHTAGLVAAGLLDSPVGIADVVTFTSHKTMNGPRGAVVLTTNAKLYRRLDRAVFPGLQGGPHMETIAGITAAMKLAQTERFCALQAQTVANARALATALDANGVRVAYGGTDGHMVLVDCKGIQGPDGTPLMGDPAARILDLAGIVTNRNTIPGDTTAAYPSGVRLGTPWVTQRGLKEKEMQQVAALIANLFKATTPYAVARRGGPDYRARVDFDGLETVKLEVAALADEAGAPCVGMDAEASVRRPAANTGDQASVGRPAANTGYPHFYYINDVPRGSVGDLRQQKASVGRPAANEGNNKDPYERLELEGRLAKPFVDWLTPSHTADMADGEARSITLLEAAGEVMAAGRLTRVDATRYYLDVPIAKAARVMTWLRELVDGYVMTDDRFGRLPFLDAVRDLGEAPAEVARPGEKQVDDPPYVKPYFIGAWSHKEPAGEPLPKFTWEEDHDAPLRTTRLHEVHREMGARMVSFGGWDMPVWYTSNSEEHHAVREAAGLFDVSHMGCWEVSGSEAQAFLNLIMVNDVNMLNVGESQYSALFDVDGIPLDDLLVYQLDTERYLVVVNAANNDKDWAWANAVLRGEVMIDPARPWATWRGEDVVLQDLRDPAAGEAMRVELALQGPKSKDILLAMGGDQEDLAKIRALPWAGITHVTLGDGDKYEPFDMIVSRTGYTGERTAYELFVHPDRLVAFWQCLLEVGAPFGIKPCGLAARDSLRIEAGLPLYGHEMAGPLHLTMADAGFATYIKLYKPFFVGREAYIAREADRATTAKAEVVRFRVPEKGHPKPESLDRVVDARGRVVGYVTSCAIDTEGYLLGQAYVQGKYQDEGTQLAVLVTPRRAPTPQDQLEMGDRTQLPVPIVVLRRFPKR
jgi:glycine hydroxymethyltransferase